MILRAKPIWPLTDANLTSPQGADNYVKVPNNDLSVSIKASFYNHKLLFGRHWFAEESHPCFAQVHCSGNVCNVLQLIFVILSLFVDIDEDLQFVCKSN